MNEAQKAKTLQVLNVIILIAIFVFLWPTYRRAFLLVLVGSFIGNKMARGQVKSSNIGAVLGALAGLAVYSLLLLLDQIITIP